jgi:Gly-Xaa carboxypeptidase
LQGAVKIPKESFDDMGQVGEDPRWNVFVDFHAYLEKTFPLVYLGVLVNLSNYYSLNTSYSKLEITGVNAYGIPIDWKGKDGSLKLYLFMAHQDIVPVL